MRSFYFVFVTFVVATLTGCASTKQELTSEGYGQIAQMYAISHVCGVSGRMSPEIAALGKDYAWKLSQRFLVDVPRLDKVIQQISFTKGWTTQEKCNEMAILIQGIKSKEAPAQAMPQIPFMPRTTTCNTYFGTTYCNSY